VIDKARRKAAEGRRRKDSEEGAARGNPRQRSLQHPRPQVTVEQVGDRQGGERAIGGQVGAKQGRRRADARLSERGLQERRRKVDDRGRVADQRQRRADALEGGVVDRHREMAGLAAGGCAQVG
jgi:hypothetical protein